MNESRDKKTWNTSESPTGSRTDCYCWPSLCWRGGGLYSGIYILYLYFCALIVINCNARNHSNVLIEQCSWLWVEIGGREPRLARIATVTQQVTSCWSTVPLKELPQTESSSVDGSMFVMCVPSIAPTSPGVPAIAMKLALVLINCWMTCGLERALMVDGWWFDSWHGRLMVARFLNRISGLIGLFLCLFGTLLHAAPITNY